LIIAGESGILSLHDIHSATDLPVNSLSVFIEQRRLSRLFSHLLVGTADSFLKILSQSDDYSMAVSLVCDAGKYPSRFNRRIVIRSFLSRSGLTDLPASSRPEFSLLPEYRSPGGKLKPRVAFVESASCFLVSIFLPPFGSCRAVFSGCLRGFCAESLDTPFDFGKSPESHWDAALRPFPPYSLLARLLYFFFGLFLFRFECLGHSP